VNILDVDLEGSLNGLWLNAWSKILTFFIIKDICLSTTYQVSLEKNGIFHFPPPLYAKWNEGGSKFRFFWTISFLTHKILGRWYNGHFWNWPLHTSGHYNEFLKSKSAQNRHFWGKKRPKIFKAYFFILQVCISADKFLLLKKIIKHIVYDQN